MTSTLVSQVREFNRFYTNIIGVLDEGLVKTPYSLTEARVIFELAQRELTEVTALRRDLSLDAGYLSRILARFETDGLVDRAAHGVDARRQVIRLTAAGRAAFEQLDRRSAGQIEQLVGGLDEDGQRRLAGAMGTVRSLLSGPQPASSQPPPAQLAHGAQVRLRAPGPGDYGWVVGRHGALYQREYGWDSTFEALVARVVADFGAVHDPARERAWIAELVGADGTPGERVGCIFCVRDTDEVAKLRLLLVEPGTRGMGVGGRLVDACVDFARQAGYRRLVLWTNDVLVEARRLYQRAGFQLVSERPEPNFGQPLVSQDWALDLSGVTSSE
jgi:DNA-binding MarR family transcriptional regulator/GNAT superfamily N-acetyltransferase